MTKFASIADATASFRRSAGDRLADNVSVSIPVPVRRDGAVQLLVFVYKSTPIYGESPRPAPPHAAAWLDGHSARVFSYRACRPAELGISDPTARPWPPATEMVLGAEIWLVVRRLEARLEEIAPTVYGAFARGVAPNGRIGQLAKDYFHVVKELVDATASPFYDQAAREFFDWLRRADPNEPDPPDADDPSGESDRLEHLRTPLLPAVPGRPKRASQPQESAAVVEAARQAAGEALACYGDPSQAMLEQLPGSRDKESWLVRSHVGAFVLQRLHRCADPAMHHHLAAVMACLAGAGLVTPRLIQARDGRLWVDLAERGIWRLVTFVPGACFAAIASEAQAQSAGELVGRFHAAVAALAPVSRIPSPDIDAALAALLRALARRSEHPNHARALGLAEAIVTARATLEPCPAAPPWIGHGDLAIDGVRFAGAERPERDRAICLLDLDAVGPVHLADEIGAMWCSWCSRALPDGTVTFDVGVMAASWRGWTAGLGRAPSPAERSSALLGVEHASLRLAAQNCTLSLDDATGPGATARDGSEALIQSERQLALFRSAVALRPARAAIVGLVDGR